MDGETLEAGNSMTQQTAATRAVSVRRRIAVRLLIYILLFSVLVTLASTAVQLALEYRRDMTAIETRLEEVRSTALGSLAGSLWRLDGVQLRLQLEGLLHLPDMRALEVRETYTGLSAPLVVAVGHRGTGAVIAREYPIIHPERGPSRPIGTLFVEVGLDAVYDRLLYSGLIILATQGVKVFLVSLFTLFIVWRLVTRHLIAMAAFLDAYDVRRALPELRLKRRARSGGDELDRVVAAFNGLCVSLQRAYADLRDANVALERDIEERRAAEAEIVRLNAVLEQRVHQRTAELEAANNELAAFTHSVSHDLRAPLRRIEGFGRALAEEYRAALGDNGGHYLERIRAGVAEMGDMVDAFLELARASRGEMAPEPVDLSALAREVAADLAEREPDRKVALSVEPGLSVRGDRRLLKAALTNLLDNAWKYTREAANPAVRVGRLAVDGRTAFFVRDNGIGFDPAFASRLFRPFNRLHPGEQYEGCGIGLATVQRIVARHGGRVWAEGMPGQGATILFTCWDGAGTWDRPDPPPPEADGQQNNVEAAWPGR